MFSTDRAVLWLRRSATSRLEAMRFEKLPENWNTLPLDDGPLAAGVIDLVMGYRDRLRHSLLVLPCDEYDVPLPTPMLFGDVDWSEPGPARREKLQFLPQVPAAGFVVALSARRRLPANLVRCWLRTFEDTLELTRVDLRRGSRLCWSWLCGPRLAVSRLRRPALLPLSEVGRAPWRARV